MKLETFRCDLEGCGKLKMEANHWWSIEIIQNPGGTPQLRIIPHKLWVEPSDYALKDFCGIECVQKFVSRWMAEVAK